jgi:hypothetical protein
LDTPNEAILELEFKVSPLVVAETNTRMLILDNLSFILESIENHDNSTMSSTNGLHTRNSRNPSIEMFGNMYEGAPFQVSQSFKDMENAHAVKGS